MASPRQCETGGSPPAIPSFEELLKALEESVADVLNGVLIEFESIEEFRDSGHPSASGDGDGGDIGVAVRFDGLFEGFVALRCYAGAAEYIARTLLFMEPEDEVSPEDVEDALGESANLVCGTLKCRTLDPVDTFSMGVPERVATKGSGGDDAQMAFQLPKGIMTVELWLQDGVCPKGESE